jgi:hypothetical protein
MRTVGPAREKLPSGAPCGFRARLHQLREALIPRGTKNSHPASSSAGSVTNCSGVVTGESAPVLKGPGIVEYGTSYAGIFSLAPDRAYPSAGKG